MVKANASSQSGTVERSEYEMNCHLFTDSNGTSYDARFGHAFMMDSGSSTGEIIGHSKVRMLRLLHHKARRSDFRRRLSML